MMYPLTGYQWSFLANEEYFWVDSNTRCCITSTGTNYSLDISYIGSIENPRILYIYWLQTDLHEENGELNTESTRETVRVLKNIKSLKASMF